MRSASLRARAAEAFAAEWLAFDHCADLVAVDVEIADAGMLFDIIADRVDAALQAKSQPEPCRVDRVHNLVELIRGKTGDVEDGTEILAVQLTQGPYLV